MRLVSTVRPTSTVQSVAVTKQRPSELYECGPTAMVDGFGREIELPNKHAVATFLSFGWDLCFSH